MSSGLILAHELIDAGIPVVTCTPNLGYRPGSNETDVNHPGGWSTITAHRDLVARYRPGTDTLAMVTGHGLDVVDPDAKAGATLADLPDIEHYGCHITPSGGWHLLVPSTGLGKGALKTAGGRIIGDYCGGTRDGGGRALAYLPGSTRPKYPGLEYTAPDPWDIAAALESEPDPLLVGYLTGVCGLTPEGQAASPAASSAEVDRWRADHEHSTGCRYGEAALGRIIAEAPTMPGQRHPYYATTLTRVVELVNSGCLTVASVDTLETAFRAAKPDSAGEWQGMLRWAVSNAGVKLCTHTDAAVTEWIHDANTRARGEAPEAEQDNGTEPPKAEPPKAEAEGRQRSMRDRLVDLAAEAFTLGRSDDDRAYLVERDGPNVALLSGGAKRRLAAVARHRLGTTPGRAPLDEAWQAIEGMAAEVDKTPLPLRVAEHNGTAVVDLGTADGRAVIVDADGWRIITRSPVTFRRSKAQLPLPDPVAGGSVDPLWRVVNVAPGARDIVRAWMATTVLRSMPHPIPQIRGEQGSAKTTATHYLGAMLDPCAVGTLTPPSNADRWAASAAARWVLPVDNVSKIDPWWSDDLCRTVTGSGTLTRQLYSDDDVVAKPLRGCVILNGISLTSALRSDLAERLLPFDLVRPGEYLTEAQVGAHFAEHHAVMLGAVLDDAAAILANRGKVAAPRDLRMADFAAALAAFDAATGSDTLGVYRLMHDEAQAEALDSDAVARTVLDHLAPGQSWEGTASDLLAALTAVRGRLVDARELDPGGYWPSDGARLSQSLNRSGPLLKARGVTYAKGRGHGGVRTIRVQRAPDGDAGDAGDANSPYVAPWGGKGDSGASAPGDTKNATSGRPPSPASPASPEPPRAPDDAGGWQPPWGSGEVAS